MQRPSGDSSSAFEQDEQDWRQNRATLDKFHNGTMQEDVSPAALEHAQKPKKLIKMMLAAARDDSADADHDEGFGIMMIHQLIETIEFVLGTVSNTASYLRLWALSLAHSQLASVFFSFTVKAGLSASGTFVSVIMVSCIPLY